MKTQLEKSCEIYGRLMEEIKRRHSVIAQVLNGTISMPQMAAFEFCYLQLRKICEVFALGCLAAHGDIPQIRIQLQRPDRLPGAPGVDFLDQLGLDPDVDILRFSVSCRGCSASLEAQRRCGLSAPS